MFYAFAFGKISLIFNGFFLRWNPSKEYLSMLLSSEELAKDMVRISNSGICIFYFTEFLFQWSKKGIVISYLFSWMNFQVCGTLIRCSSTRELQLDDYCFSPFLVLLPCVSSYLVNFESCAWRWNWNYGWIKINENCFKHIHVLLFIYCLTRAKRTFFQNMLPKLKAIYVINLTI